MRTQIWLNDRLKQIWEFLFQDLEKPNKVLVTFRGKSKNIFGYIESKRDNTLIVINGLFRSERVPEFVIDNTIAHELIHYLHGFHSPHERKVKHPHRYGVVEKEMRKRGFSEVMKKENIWYMKEWNKIYEELISR